MDLGGGMVVPLAVNEDTDLEACIMCSSYGSADAKGH